MDIKSITKSNYRKKTAKRSRTSRGNPATIFTQLRTVAQNQTVLHYGRWHAATLFSGTTGNISSSISASIANSSEYSILQSLWTEVRLRSFKLTLTPIQTNSTSNNQSYIVLGTNMLFNQTTFTTPASSTAVVNCTQPGTTLSAAVRQYIYYMKVPPDLEYLGLGTSASTGDSPTVPAPFAGSPGAVVIWGDSFSSSLDYWQVEGEAVWQLRGRQ